METHSLVAIAAVVAVIIGFTLGRYRTYAFQNRGDARLSRAIGERFRPPDYYLLNHLTLRVEDGTDLPPKNRLPRVT